MISMRRSLNAFRDIASLTKCSHLWGFMKEPKSFNAAVVQQRLCPYSTVRWRLWIARRAGCLGESHHAFSDETVRRARFVFALVFLLVGFTCIWKTSCLEVLFQCVLTSTLSRECKVWLTMIISPMKAMMMIPTAAEVVVRRLVLFVLFVLSKWRKVWPSKTNWLHMWLMWLMNAICVLVCLLHSVVIVFKIFLSLSLFSNHRLEACNWFYVGRRSTEFQRDLRWRGRTRIVGELLETSGDQGWLIQIKYEQ